MNISFYLFLGIVVIALLLLVKVCGERNGLNRKTNVFRWAFFIVLCIMGLLSMMTVRRYMYPKDTAIFANSDYHILEHRGFAVGKDTFDLVKNRYPDAYAPEESLWDGKSGRVTLTADSILLSEYHEPFYISQREGRKDYSFVLANRANAVDASEGFEITRDGRTLYRMDIIPYDKDSCLYVTVTGGGERRDTSTFRKLIRQGYPLCDIIASTPGYVFTEELYQILQGTLLVRERIKIDNLRYGGESRSSDVCDIDLAVMPGQSWYYDYQDVLINALPVAAERDFSVAVDSARTMFYSGMGRTKTDVYSFKATRNGLRLEYTLPKMQHFSKDHSRVFLTSSVAAVMDDPKEGGYYYNIFELDDNRYHINAEMRYKVGTSTETLAVEVMDLYSADPSQKITSHEFNLATHSPDVEWMFAVRDLRAENPMGWDYIFRILFTFIFLVLIRLAVDYFLQTKSLSYLELSVYIVILCMTTVRLIISWRVSTFVPIEDVTGPVFAKMRNGTSGWTCFVYVYPLALTLWSVLKGWTWSRSLLDGTAARIADLRAGLDEYCRTEKWAGYVFGPKMRVPVLFLAGLLLCFLGSRISPLSRLLNIPGPLILYILFELWIAVKECREGESLVLLRIVISLALMGYLFLADAGFIVVFAVYLVLLHCIIGPLTDSIPAFRGRKSYLKYLLSGFSLLAVFAILKYEGELMIWLFDNIRWMSKVMWVLLSLAVAVLSGAVFLVVLSRNDSQKHTGAVYAVYAVCVVLCAASLVFTNYFGDKIAEKVEGKAHMKWRAEVQKLDEDKNETIDDLMLKCDFNSSDITFIMRSAHNQWFINQYFKEGDSCNHNRYFELQPHSNQGSTFTTQTTDLAITRYVTAEHGHWPARWMLLLFLILISIYCFEIRFGDEDGKLDRVLLGALVLMFTLALLVYLSATNRIVFIGQDFPFMSIQSRVAVIFPVLLMLIATFPVMNDRMAEERGMDSGSMIRQKYCIPLFLFLFYILTIVAIKPLGVNQDDTQFDVSAIIQDVSSKVDVIDRDFERFQRINDMISAPKDQVWEEFKNSPDDISRNLRNAMTQTSDSTKFFASLLAYFDSEQVDKDDPEELLHMRKRNGIWHLAVNKKHFFIPSKKSVAEMWKGHVYAARVHREFKFADVKGDGTDENFIDSTKSYEPNIIPKNLRDRIANVKLVKFDKSWTPDSEPLILVTSKQARGSRQFYHIESHEGAIKGSSSRNQVATRVKRGDVLILNVLDRRGEVEEVVSWKYDMEADRYLAKNIWLNGRNRLFYPMGKDFIWSYQFANLVSTVYGKDDQYRDSSIRLSLDYELHKKFSRLLASSNSTKVHSISSELMEDLMKFAQKPMSLMISKNNRSSFYYDAAEGKVKCKRRRTSEIDRALTRVNRNIEQKLRHNHEDRNNALLVSDAVYEAIERLYEFTAVAIDGDGKIRLMFDHGKTRVVDPNNVSHFNQFLSELYKAGDNSSERDVFGNKTLQILPSGPGSTFKPIMYTAVTSNQKIAWESIDVLAEGQEAARSVRNHENLTAAAYDCYGGVDVGRYGEGPLSIDSYGALLHNNYLTYSDNLYHSVIVLLGMQPQGKVLDIMKPAGTGKLAFPVFTYNGQRKSFDPDKWFPDGQLDVENGILNVGLSDNFNLMELMPASDLRYTNYFGNSGPFVRLFRDAGNYRGWVFAESGSQNVPDRALAPHLRNGFNQMFLGASPLEVSPLQMGTMVMRLATLNKAANITTLSDDPSFKPEYEFFDNYGWNNDEEYFSFYKRQVLSQLRLVPKVGTARGLSADVSTWESKGYYVYAKTGTLNDGREGHGADSRMKHLLVIISNTPLESVSDVEDLKDVKYYAMYMSYIGVSRYGFSNSAYAPMIDAVIDSELFKKYMEE